MDVAGELKLQLKETQCSETKSFAQEITTIINQGCSISNSFLCQLM